MSIIAAAALAACSSAPEIVTDIPSQSFKAPKGGMVQAFMINHGSVGFAYKDLMVQVDPVGNYGGKQIDYSSLPKADLVLVCHEHGDHLDPAIIKEISKEGTVVACNAASAPKLEGAVVMGNGDTKTLAGIEVNAVPAYNISEGHTRFHPKGNGNGYVFTLGGLVIYVAGDTEDIDEIAELKGRVDVAFLPVNQPYTMTVEQCIKATRALCPKVLVPYHLGDTDIQAIKDGLAGSGIEVYLFESLR